MIEACDAYRDIEDAAREIPAPTLEGLLAKARIFSEDILDQLNGSGAEFGFESLIADIEAISGIGNTASTV